MNDNLRQVTNPSDKITIDYTDKDAARMAVIIIGRGKYGISGDDGLPVFLFGGHEEWAQQEYQCTFDKFVDSVPKDRIATALESLKNVHNRTSLNDIVGRAHAYAEAIRAEIAREAA